MMLAKFGEDASMLAIATEKTKLDASWLDAEKTAFAQTQDKIYRLLLGSLSMVIANRFLEHKLGSDVWKDLFGRYEGIADLQRNSLEVRRLLAKLHNCKGHHGSMEAHLRSMFQIRDRFAIPKHLVQDEDMKSALLKSIPGKSEHQHAEEFTSRRASGDTASSRKDRQDKHEKPRTKLKATKPKAAASSGKCFECGEHGHIAWECSSKSSEGEKEQAKKKSPAKPKNL
ncbi:hypothetical protein PybrP1_000848, partial [[Pythium] brassicae (nom. inval.)]